MSYLHDCKVFSINEYILIIYAYIFHSISSSLYSLPWILCVMNIYYTIATIWWCNCLSLKPNIHRFTHFTTYLLVLHTNPPTEHHILVTCNLEIFIDAYFSGKYYLEAMIHLFYIFLLYIWCWRGKTGCWKILKVSYIHHYKAFS